MWVLGDWEPVHKTADLVIIGELGDGPVSILGLLKRLHWLSVVLSKVCTRRLLVEFPELVAAMSLMCPPKAYKLEM